MGPFTSRSQCWSCDEYYEFWSRTSSNTWCIEVNLYFTWWIDNVIMSRDWFITSRNREAHREYII